MSFSAEAGLQTLQTHMICCPYGQRGQMRLSWEMPDWYNEYRDGSEIIIPEGDLQSGDKMKLKTLYAEGSQGLLINSFHTFPPLYS